MKAEVTFSDGRQAVVEGETKEAIAAAVAQYEQSLAPKKLDTVLPDVVAETVGGINRGAAAIPDFFIDAGNAALDLAGVETKLPRVGDFLEKTTGGTKNFMEPGLARTVVQEGSEWIPGLATLGRDKFMQATKKLTPEILAAQRSGVQNPALKAGNESNIPILTSDVRPPKTFVGKQAQKAGERIPLVGTQGSRMVQQEMRDAAARNFVNKYDDFSYEAIVSSLKKSKDRVKRAAGNVLQKTGSQLDDVGPMPKTKTAAAIESAKKELIKPGQKVPEGFVSNLDELEGLLQTDQPFSVLKNNRSWWRGVKDGVDDAGKSQLPSYAKAQAEKIYKALSDDMDDFARANLPKKQYQSWRNANALYADEAAKFSRTRLKNVLDKGDFRPEDVANVLFSQKPSEVKSLHQSLTPSGRSNARAAIINKVVDNVSRRKSGFTPNSFITELKKYDSQIDIFFSGKERKQLEGLRRALEATTRAQDASVATPTGQDVYSILSILGIAVEPGVALPALGTAGAAARIYESAPVRNALLRLANAPKGTPVFDSAVASVVATLTTAAQKAKPEPESESTK